jgi:hypothetical protein
MYAMKNILSITIFALLFLGLGALALTAAPSDLGIVTGSAPEVEAAEVAAANKFNLIGMPLDSSASVTPFQASGLASYMGASVKQVMKWNAASQIWASYIPGQSPPPLNFGLAVGGAYMVEVDSTSGAVVSFVGDVPAQGSVSNLFVPAPTAVGCNFNTLTIPLDRADITTASGLAADIGGVDQVMNWNAASQIWTSYIPGQSPPPLNFATKIGYPYMVCLDNTAPTVWQ